MSMHLSGILLSPSITPSPSPNCSPSPFTVLSAFANPVLFSDIFFTHLTSVLHTCYFVITSSSIRTHTIASHPPEIVAGVSLTKVCQNYLVKRLEREKIQQ